MPKQACLWLPIAPALLFVTALYPMTALAEGIRILTDLEYVNSNAETENKVTGEKTETDYSWLSQLYDVDIQKEIFPYLNFRTGGLFELNAMRSTTVRPTSDGSGTKTRTKTEDRTTRLFAELNLNNPLYRGGAAYRRTEFKESATNIASTTITREEYNGLWTWRPAGLPVLDLSYHRFHTYDDAETRDSIDELLTLKTRYDYRALSFDYTYTRSDTEEEFSDSGALTQIHNGSLRYSTGFFDNRLSLTAGSRVNYVTVDALGTGDVELPTTSLGDAFYLLDDPVPDSNDPDEFTAVDADNPLSTVNIGRDGPTNQISVGLDFGSRTEVAILHVLPVEDARNPDLASPGQIAAAFVDGGFRTWEVYTSDDQENWEGPHPLLREVSYSVFDNRFEISLPTPVEKQYIKVVTTPQSDMEGGEVRIAELRAFTILPGTAGSRLETFDQNYNLGLRWAITDSTTASYDTYYRRVERDPLDTRRSTLTNSVSLRHVFSPVFSSNARLLRRDITESGEDDAHEYAYGVSLRGDYLDTLSQTLVYSGTNGEDEEGSNSANSILLRTNADLYTDWSLNLDLGYSWNKPSEGGRFTSTFLRIATNLVPNRRMHLTLDYSVSYSTETGEPHRLDQSGGVRAFWVPLKTLSLFAGVNLRKDTRARDDSLRIAQDYSIDWAPFPDGPLAFSFGYNWSEDREGERTQAISPEIKWRVSRAILVSLRYTVGTVESETERRDAKIFTANVRIFY